MYVLAEEFSKP